MGGDPMSAFADRCLHQLVEDQVERTPDAVAVVGGSRRLTYRELDQRANQVAHRLQALGAGPETLVAVYADRSAGSLVAILGVLKAGAAYVPLDSGSPAGRLRFIVEDAGAAIVVAGRPIPDEVGGGLATISPDDCSALPVTAPTSPVTADNLAYLMYTSGSTGRPKGVLVSHRQIVHSTRARFAYDAGYEPTAFLLLLSFSFDAAGCGLYWTLCRGGRVVIATSDELNDLEALRQVAADNQVTHLDCAPSLYALILGAGARGFESLRHANVGGEACPAPLVAEHYRLLPRARLVNDYGPTEATIWCTRYDCQPGDAVRESIPIGRPIPGVDVHVLDADLGPAPEGVPGELCVGGAGVARGYRGMPALTGDRFVPNPYSERPGQRMYRTGDLCTSSSGGELVFLGRVDRQVKIRGYRVELDEIEAALVRHASVLQAVLVLAGAAPDAQRLVAYVVPRSGRRLSREEMAAFLLDELPPYMIPNQFQFVESLPRSSSGKLDRAALALRAAAPPDVRPRTAPTSDLERQVATVVAEALALPTVGVEDDLFELGLNSLTMTRVVHALFLAHGLRLRFAQVFQEPTVAGVARLIEATASGAQGVSPVAATDLDEALDLSIVPQWTARPPDQDQ
jgi:amino acid adenylation domain-containing protein